MENSAPSHRHRLAWLALATFGTLCLFPATRTLLRAQLKMEALTYSTRTDLAAERAVGAKRPDDYPVQLAMAAQNRYVEAANAAPALDGRQQAELRSRRLEALTQRFPNRPSTYANFMRYMTMGEIRVMRDQDIFPAAPGSQVTPSPTSPESLKRFEAAAKQGAQLDPDNAYFPMMRAICLFNTRQDREALAAIRAAGHCSRWTEYYQDEAEGQERLQVLTYGDRGAVQRMRTAAEILFPQYAQLRSASRIAIYLAAQEERAGNTEEALLVRHAVMRCGGLMRAQGSSYITTLVGIAIVNIATSDPGGVSGPESLVSARYGGDDTEQRLELRRRRYYAYLESLGQSQEAAWTQTEIAAGDQAKAIGTESLHYSIFDAQSLSRLALGWLVNLALLSGALVLLILGAAAQLAGSIRPQKTLWLWRSVYALLIVGGIGFWQWQAISGGMSPYVQIQDLFANVSGPNNSTAAHMDMVQIFQRLIICLGLLAPVLFVGLIAAITLKQRVPLATGLGRGLRGAAMPAAALLFLCYAASLLPTAQAEKTLTTEIARVIDSEPRYFAEVSHKAWPSDPQP